ncbi:MAG: hypothetical protein ACREU3_03965 [Steroidobacteraceae bacterium]
MPIRRELRPLYPPHWKELSQRVRFGRAHGRCEICGRPHAVLIRCLLDGRWFDPVRRIWRDRHGRRARWPDLLALIPQHTTHVVLAAAHLDNDPRNNRLSNLKSLCQRCHMLHDRPYHLAQRWLTYRRRYAAADLFLGRYQAASASDGAAKAISDGGAGSVSLHDVMRVLAARRPKEGINPNEPAAAPAPVS